MSKKEDKMNDSVDIFTKNKLQICNKISIFKEKTKLSDSELAVCLGISKRMMDAILEADMDKLSLNTLLELSQKIKK